MISLRAAVRTRVALIRPGSTEFDEQGRFKGSLDMPLSELGRDQADQLAHEMASLHLDAIYSAPCQSALQTADRLCRDRELKPKSIDALRNVDHGLWHGKLIEEIRRNQPRLYRSLCDAPDSFCPPGGETIDEARSRADKAVRRILRRRRNEVVALVVPDPLASLISSELGEEPLSKAWSMATDAGHWQLIDALT
ncbi:MAG: histidine phosphatase family protein [Planctomycetota bacterium]